MAYEQVTFEQLPNRAGHVERYMGEAVTPDQAYIVLYQQADGNWWNGRETEDEAKALEVAARLERNGSVVKIVQAVKVQPEVKEKTVDGYYDTHQPLQGTYIPVQHVTESDEEPEGLYEEVSRLLQEKVAANPKKYKGPWSEWTEQERYRSIISQIFHDTPLAQQALKNIKGNQE